MGYMFSRKIAVITFERKLTINKDWRVNVTKFLRAAISVAGLAVMLNVSAAQAVDVENYEATVEFAKQIANCYDMAPPALLVWVGNPKVIVVKDFTTFAKIDSVIGVPAGYIQQFFSKTTFTGQALIGNKSGVVRSLIFREDKLKHDKYFMCKMVYHELMHLYDMKYGSHARRGTAEKSDRPEFQEAYKADVIQANAYLTKLTITKDQQKLIDYYRYFISSSAEAFAEVGATILYVHPQSRHYKNIDFLFPRLMAMVRLELIMDKIIETGHIGKVRDHLQIPSTLSVAK